ncbi:MAG: hypothetical protein HKO66_09920 [Saprospiraceae bacterium]|nr:hypothetical protein [Bacteroidia bacterium]NNE16080.1 hypothetical protein [Saprospiraceae bacterium]NNL92537.1 hypothetical protein [Saprospiraceae bacterium]
MPVTADKKNIKTDDYSFVRLKDIQQLLENSMKIPYSVKFSLKPYLNAIRSRFPMACPNTKMALMPLLEGSQEHIESKMDNLEDILDQQEFQTLLGMAIPSLLYDNELSYISSPFRKNFIVKTPAFETLFDSEELMLKMDQEMIAVGFTKNIQQAGIHILNTLYGQNIDNEMSELLTIYNKKTKIEKHYRINLRFDFITVNNTKPLPELSETQINFLLKNQNDLELWLKHLPADTFEFSGFAIGNFYDITDIQVLSDLKNWLGFNTHLRPEVYFNELGTFIKSYLGEEDVQIGGFILNDDPVYKDSNVTVTEKSTIDELLIQDEKYEDKGIFDHLLTAKRVLYISDLTMLEKPSEAEKLLLKKGVKSYVLSPLLDENQNIISILELSSGKPNTFNFKSVPKLQPIFEQLILSFENFAKDLDNRITAVIQKNFTSIHPSVAWKFEEVAKEYYNKRQNGVEDLTMSPIVFKDVYPLYGQSDIVNSSKIRNDAIQQDLVENLEGLRTLLDKWTKQKKLHLLESYASKVNKILNDLKTEFISTNESGIVKLISQEIHPILLRLKSRHKELSNKAFERYESIIDPQLGIVYHKRKNFEKSVTKLNAVISEFMEKDEAEMQKVLPHFFEKYKTDGVEYNVYLGQSILQDGDFSLDDLKNFRLWQLVNSCEVTRLVEKISPKLDLPLTTAELIFVYNNPLSIRFRMDEKKFDVDGAYNVRYEILKKRIDKAYIKDTDERLTQAGKVAIVYLSDSDKAQYLEFIEYLLDKGYIEDNIEDLTLSKLQGADGLRALRVTVKH